MRDVYLSAVTGWGAEFLAGDSVDARAATWEQLYAFTKGRDRAAPRYCAPKRREHARVGRREARRLLCIEDPRTETPARTP
jgi:hypothetical protein